MRQADSNCVKRKKNVNVDTCPIWGGRIKYSRHSNDCLSRSAFFISRGFLVIVFLSESFLLNCSWTVRQVDNFGQIWQKKKKIDNFFWNLAVHTIERGSPNRDQQRFQEHLFPEWCWCLLLFLHQTDTTIMVLEFSLRA